MSNKEKNTIKTKEAIKRVLENGETRIYSEDGHCIMTLKKNVGLQIEDDDLNLDEITDTDIKSKSTWFD